MKRVSRSNQVRLWALGLGMIAAASLCTPEAAAQAKADLSVTMSVSPSAPKVGDIMLYTINVTNNGPDDATGVVVTWAPGSASGTVISGCPNVPICQIGFSPLSAGSAYTATLNIRFTFNVSGTYTSAATVTANEFDPNTANNSASANIMVRPLTANLSVTMSVSPTAPKVGDVVIYTINVTNNGPDDATGVVVTWVPGTASGTVISGCPNVPICQIGFSPLSAGSAYTATLNIRFTFNVSGTYTSAATVTANEFDPNTANNSASANIKVRPLTADLSLTMSVSPSAPKVGDIVTYAIDIKNNGPDDANGAVLTWVPGASSGTFNNFMGSCMNLICHIQLSQPFPSASQETIHIQFIFTVSGTFTSAATVTANEFDPNTANNSASATVKVPNAPPIARAGPAQKLGTLGAPVTFTLDGSASSDPDGNALTFKWWESGGLGHATLVGTTPVIQLTRGPGNYHFSLTVSDGVGGTGSDAVLIQVVPDTTSPLVDAPDLTVSVTEPGSATVSKSTPLSNYVLSGATTSAVDDVDPQPQFLRVIANNLQVTSSTFFPEGDTPLSVFYIDQAGNVGMSPATIHVVDRQDDDIFILTGEGNCFFTSCNDVIQRVRGGVVEDYCTLAGGSSPGRGIMMDSSGRVVALREPVNIAGSSGLEMVRCSVKGAPPEKFAFFQWQGGLPAGYPEPFPALRVLGVPFGAGGGGLTLARLREVVIDDNQNSGQPFIVNEDAYIFNLQIPAVTQRSTNKSVMYHVKQAFWEDGPDLGSLAGPNGPASMFFNSGTTYVSGAGTGCLRRDKIPLSIHATGNVSGVSFNLQLSLFSSSGEFCGLILNDVTVPDLALCPGTPPPNPAPTDGNALAVMTEFTQVFFDDLHGHGLTLISNSGATVNGILTNFSQEPLDNPSDPSNFFGNPFIGCALTEEVRYTPLYHGGYFGGPIAIAPRGLIAMFGGVGFSNSSLDEVTSSGQLTPIVSGGLGPVGFVTAWPPNVSAGAAISVLIRIDSPVDVLVTDPNGKKLGMQNGAPVNDFGNDGSDTGAGSHPRFYAINNPIPGDYRVDSVGTGIGPFTVHVYSVDTAKPFGQHILSSGNAAPGAPSNQNFTFGAGGGIAFTNHLPTANAGPDQTVNAAANGTATVNLDGSASNDPDGDSLTFTWAGPFGLVNGTQPQVTLPVGVNVLALTVDDGKGGTASANVTITVNPPADTTPPVVTPPANISIPATEAGGARGNASAALAAFLAGGTAVDNVDPSPARLSPQVGGVNADNTTLFALGTTTVTFSFSDASGNVGMANASVTVVLGTPRISAAVIGKGVDVSGARYVDLQLTNTGTGNARNVKINQLPLRTLSGTGTVSYNTTLSLALPISIGSLDVGGPKTVRLFFNVPATVTRYSLTESGTLQDVAATNYSFSASQSVIP